MLNKKALAGTAGAPKVYVEDVFSTYLYTGNGSTQTITNNIDLSGEGGMVWQKDRTTAGTDGVVCDTARGVNAFLRTSGTYASVNNGSTDAVYAYNSNGFSTSTTNGFNINLSDAANVSWTFRKAEKFFDVVTYTGDNTSSKAISHNLGSVPGCVIVKRTDSTSHWFVWHRSTSGTPNNDYTLLNQTAATAVATDAWSSNAFTSTQFYVSNNLSTNVSGATYVAYVFAHNAGGFGDAGSDSIIKCGSYTTDGSGNATVTLDWEPQWLLTKLSSTTGDWRIIDNMRQMSLTNNFFLYPNTSGAEVDNTVATWIPTATGFTHNAANANQTFIYIAIRRGPMKTPTTGTSVFAIDTRNSTSGAPKYKSGFVTDMNFNTIPNSAGTDRNFEDRLRGQKRLVSNSTAAEAAGSTNTTWDYMNGWGVSETTYADQYSWMFRRAPGFFDVVCWTATGSAQTLSHNLQAVPELMIRKRLDSATGGQWDVYAAPLGATNILLLNDTSAVDANTAWNNTTPTSSVVYMNNTVNGWKYVTYLFASLSGVSKVGTYTGNGSSVTVTTNFQPRFILVKRTDSTGDWIVSDSARGLVAGNDPYLELNTTDAEVTNEDWVDISSTSFTVNQTTNNANVNTGTYLYLAIA